MSRPIPSSAKAPQKLKTSPPEPAESNMHESDPEGLHPRPNQIQAENEPFDRLVHGAGADAILPVSPAEPSIQITASQAEATAVKALTDKLRETESKLRVSEGRLHAILDSAIDYAIITTDERGIVTSWNEGAWRILGWREDEIVGREARVIFTPEDRDAGIPDQEMQAASAKGRADDDRWHVRKDGSRFWASGILMPLRSGASGFLKILRDRTEQKKTGTALYESEVLKGAILEAALDCIVSIDHDSRIVEWNPAAERTFGYTREVALGCDIAELIIPPELRDSHHRGMAHYLATGEGPVLGKRVELEATRADGSRFPVELAISPVDIGGKPHFTAYLRDITERRRAEEKLRDQFELNRTITENVAEALFMIDAQGRVTFMNPAAERMFGWSADELRGRVLHDAIHHRHADSRPYPMDQCPLGGALRTGEVLRNREDMFFRRDGSPVHVICSNAPTRSGDNVVGAVLAVHDISDRKRHCARASSGFGPPTSAPSSAFPRSMQAGASCA